MFKLYVLISCCCDNAMLRVWLGLSTKTTLVGLRKHYVFTWNTWFCHHQHGYKMSPHLIKIFNNNHGKCFLWKITINICLAQRGLPRSPRWVFQEESSRRDSLKNSGTLSPYFNNILSPSLSMTVIFQPQPSSVALQNNYNDIFFF